MKITERAFELIDSLLVQRNVFRLTVTGTNDRGFHVSMCIDNTFYRPESDDNPKIVWICPSPRVITDMESFVYLHDKQLDYNQDSDEFIIN